ncbi:hypothetical protein C8R46DRAFT_1044122 [Mycena filopes]|nr:hypothetical protein C8R46DRAFT_1044122 [Mycena filopes]
MCLLGLLVSCLVHLLGCLASALSGLFSPPPQRDAPSEVGDSCVLPIELWDRICEFLDSDGLLVMAAVAHTFNVRCTRMHLRYHKISMQMLDSGRIVVPPDALRVLQQGLELPRITKLYCQFTQAKSVLEELRTLRVLVTQALPELQELHLGFHIDVFSAKEHHRRLADIHNAFHDVTYAMAGTTQWVMAVDSFRTSIYHPDQLRALHLEPGYRPASPLTSFLHHILGPPPRNVYHVRIYPAELEPRVDITSLALIRMYRVLTPEPYTLMVSNPDWVHMLTLKTTDATMSGHHLSQILPHLYLPNLRFLRIDSANICPTTLSHFLTRHRRLRQITYNPPPWQNITGLGILSPPDVRRMPALESVGSQSTAALQVRLDALHPYEPLIIEIPFWDFHDTKRVRPGRNLLTQLAHRKASTTTTLIITLNSIPTGRVDKGDVAIAATLHCVTTVKLRGDHWQWMIVATNLLPWLQALPALELLQIRISTWYGPGDMERFLATARATLPPTVTITDRP